MDAGRYFEWVPGLEQEGLSLPTRQTDGAAGYDLFARGDVAIAPGEIALVPTGVRVRLPASEFLAVFARSSLAIKRRLVLANGVGVVDADYYGNPDNGGEIMVSLWNIGQAEVLLTRGERIAQGVFMQYLVSAADADLPLGKTRSGGFGSTGR